MPYRNLLGQCVATPSPERRHRAKDKAKSARKAAKIAKKDPDEASLADGEVESGLDALPVDAPAKDATAEGEADPRNTDAESTDPCTAACAEAVDADEASTPKAAPTADVASANAAIATATVALSDLSESSKMLPHTNPHAVPEVGVPLTPFEPFCRLCQRPVDTLKKGVRLCKKSPQEWQCPTCNNKIAGLHSLFGTWPISAYHSLSDLEKATFWQEPESGKRALQQAVEKHIIYKQVKALVDDNLGEFLPMSVWKTKGYAEEDILKCPSEIHKTTGGRVYQMSIHTSGTTTRQELIRQEMKKLLDGPEHKTNDNAVPVGGEGASSSSHGHAREVNERERSCSRRRRRRPSSSRSRSRKQRSRSRRRRSRSRHRSRSRRKRSRSKSGHKGGTRNMSEFERAVKAKMEKEEQKLRDNAEKKRVTQLRAEATKVVSKVTSLVTELKRARNHKCFEKLPEAMAGRIEDACRTLEDYKAEANARIAGDETPLNFSFKDVQETFKTGARDQPPSPSPPSPILPESVRPLELIPEGWGRGRECG